MKIFLVYLAINSPQDTGYNYGLGYIAAMLKQKGRVVKYVSLKNNQDIESLYVKIKSERPAIIGFSATTSQFYYLSDIVKCIRTISDATIICGGTHPTLKPDCIFEIPELDGIVRGEGEFPMIDIAENIASGRDISNIANSWIRKKGEIIKNDLRPLIKNLNQLPFPDKDSLDYQKMLDQEKGINRFIFSRGCTFNCTYCSNKALRELYRDKGVYYRFESPERAIEEITNDASKFNFEKICLDDDTITLDKKWFYNSFHVSLPYFWFDLVSSLRYPISEYAFHLLSIWPIIPHYGRVLVCLLLRSDIYLVIHFGPVKK